jgi:hypothetical protein
MSDIFLGRPNARDRERENEGPDKHTGQTAQTVDLVSSGALMSSSPEVDNFCDGSSLLFR